MSPQLLLCLSIILILLPALLIQAQFNEQSLPLLSDQSICAVPPGDITSDNQDEVCLLSQCCSDWVSINSSVPSVTLSSGSIVSCSDVICPNVCRFVCERESILEPCLSAPPSACNSSDTSGDAYVFLRRSSAAGLGHVGFGFAIGPAFYMYGSLEDPGGARYIPSTGQSNGFWLRNGTFNDMLCAFSNPPFGLPYDGVYKTATAIHPDVCVAVQFAETIFGSGYLITQLGNVEGNCLNVVFDILTEYAIFGLSPPFEIPIPDQWYNNLDPTVWTQQTFTTPSNCPSLDVACQSGTCAGTCPAGGCLVTTNTLSSTCLPDKGGDCSAYLPAGGTVLYCPPIGATPGPAPGPTPSLS